MTLTVRIFIIAAATLAALHFLLLHFYLYWQYLWLDMPMHLLGGATIALGVFAARDLHVPLAKYMTHATGVMLIVLIAALAWEIFEFAANISVLVEHFWEDTASDLVLGLCGGVFGYIVGKNMHTLEV